MIHIQYGSYGYRIIRQIFGHHSPNFWSSFAKNFGRWFAKFLVIIRQIFGRWFAKFLVASSDIFKELFFERI